MCGAQRIKVAVCGGGLGGLAFTVAASKYPHLSVEVYESAAGFATFGAGIGLWPRTWDVLGRLGVAETLSSASDDDISSSSDLLRVMITFRKSDQPVGYEFLKLQSHGRMHTVHRAELQHALLKKLSGSSHTIHLSKRLQSYTREPSGKLQLTFSDGSLASCDILIGADGIKSVVRRQLMHDEAEVARRRGDARGAEDILASIEPTWTGSIAYRALVPPSRLIQKDADTRRLVVPQCPTQYVGKNANMIVYPVSQRDSEDDGLINMVVFHTQPELEGSVYEGPWSAQVDTTQWLHSPYFDQWEPEAKAWLKCVENPTRWAIHVVKELHTFVNDRVALIGDAAHAMDPHQGAGAGQALEDAFVLAELLGDTKSLKAVPQTLSTYDTLRRPFSQQVARSSRDNAHFLSLCWEGFDIHDSPSEVREKLRRLGSIITDRWKWAWLTSVSADLEPARREFNFSKCKM
ncbi:FAD/NAD(P)-binding domain-containing protein [Hymenopellis radicata]|nr:FAD/NAD(P)-binding domain-containing protein [Hymenopellis radicata]